MEGYFAQSKAQFVAAVGDESGIFWDKIPNSALSSAMLTMSWFRPSKKEFDREPGTLASLILCFALSFEPEAVETLLMTPGVFGPS